MSFESALVATLESITGLTSLVGTRIFQSAAADPATSKPYLVFDVLGTDEPGHLTGTSGLARSIVQFRSVGANMASAIEVRDALRAGLHTLKKNSGTIWDARVDNSRTAYFQPDSGQAVGTCSQEIDYIIWHAVSTPSPV